MINGIQEEMMMEAQGHHCLEKYFFLGTPITLFQNTHLF